MTCAADKIREEIRKEFGAEIADGINIQPGRSGWIPAARAAARAECREAQREAQRAALVVPRWGDYTLREDWRTGSAMSALEDIKALEAAAAAAGLETSQFIRVRPDGSGEGHWEWPCRERVIYPKGTFCS